RSRAAVDDVCGHDAARAGSDVEERARREARELAAHGAPEEVWVTVDRKIEEVLAIEQYREWLRRHGDLLLHDVRARERGEQRLLPLVLVHRPAEDDTLPAVLVIGLEHEALTLLDDEFGEVDRLAFVRRVSFAHFA